jgi:membrane-associated phospholipid phosphatase
LATGAGATAAVAHLGPGAAPVVASKLQEPALPSSGHTWLLSSPDALRPDAPDPPTATELDELLGLQAKRTDATAELVARWAGRPAVLPWLELGTQLSDEYSPSALHAIRADAHLRAAMHDAIVVALDAQTVHARPAPAVADDQITVVGDAAAESSFPSIHAAVAGAASTVLAYLFPDASSDGFAGLADEAATSRLWAGAAYRSDVKAGLDLGRAVGELAVSRGKADGSDAEWDGSGQPSGDGHYEPTPPDLVDPPFGVLAGTWKTWVLPSGDAIRPAPFPAYGSPSWLAELAAVREATTRRTLVQERIIDSWLNSGSWGFYDAYAQDLIERNGLGEAEAAGVLAMLSVATYDTFVAVWDAKYHYWIARPITHDPDLNTYIPAPPYPSYPAGFPAACGAGATVLAALFPEAETDLMNSAREGAAQRCWSGIHYVLDNDTALLMGGQVGRLVVDHVRNGAGEGES